MRVVSRVFVCLLLSSVSCFCCGSFVVVVYCGFLFVWFAIDCFLLFVVVVCCCLLCCIAVMSYCVLSACFCVVGCALLFLD